MRAWVMLGGAALALTSSLALAAPEDLLPPIFNEPTPAPAPAPSAAPTPAPTSRVTLPEGIPTTSREIVQPLPPGGGSDEGPASVGNVALPDDFPTLAELEAMDPEEIDAVLGLRPKFDVPPGAQRAVAETGLISQAEGGFPVSSLAGQPARLVRAALAGIKAPMVSRWGHILLRRTLASRLDAPEGMDPVDFVALRAAVLNRMDEGQVARALVQDVDSSNFNRALTDQAFSAYLATGDVLGMCPAARLNPTIREDGDWELLQAICTAYLGEERSAGRRLDRALGTGRAPAIDVRLAQRYAGAAGEGRRAVNIEWDGVEELTPWRFSLARALGVEVPGALLENAPARYAVSNVLIPAVPLTERVASSDMAAARGIISSGAMVDLYSELYASDQYEATAKQPADALRSAYVGSDIPAKMSAIRGLWGEGDQYGRKVLTAYACARLPLDETLTADSGELVSSMLSAGLDTNAARWSSVVEDGSLGWALLAVGAPQAGDADGGALGSFIDDDGSEEQRKSRFLVAGLAGLGRIDEGTTNGYADDLGMDLQRETNWSRSIRRAGEYRNGALVALLAGLGMQGDSWDRMTARHLFNIVRALNDAGLNAEARMIAAEAVARA